MHSARLTCGLTLICIVIATCGDRPAQCAVFPVGPQPSAVTKDKIGPGPPVAVISFGALDADGKRLQIDGQPVGLRVYHLRSDGGISARQILSVVQDLVAPGSWQHDATYARAINNRLLIRHNAVAHRRIERLLRQLEVLDVPPKNCGGLYSVIPVVGQREPGAKHR